MPDGEIEWPGFMKRIVEKFGPTPVWNCGLQVLGYPPTWVRSYGEAKRVEETLIQNEVPF